MKRMGRMARWFEESWIGDVIGVACLFGSAYGALLIGCGMGLK